VRDARVTLRVVAALWVASFAVGAYTFLMLSQAVLYVPSCDVEDPPAACVAMKRRLALLEGATGALVVAATIASLVSISRCPRRVRNRGVEVPRASGTPE